MERLWSPWREKYIEKLCSDDNECIFCKMIKEDKDRENLILFRGEASFVVMNLYPYNNGHLLIVPNKHIPEINALNESELTDLMKNTQKAVEILNNVFFPSGFNIGINQGKVSGAGVEDHIHVHIVPRWNGDTNFMPVIGEAKIISQDLLSGYDKLLKEFV